jgi:iron complex outermembrane receptor protein
VSRAWLGSVLLMGLCLSDRVQAESDADTDFEELLGRSAPSESAGPAVDDPVEVPVIHLESPPEATPANRPPQSPMLEEIVVTAEKRVSSLQDTPISIAALTAETLEIAGIEGLDDIGANVPSLQIDPFPTNNATLRFYIRGIGIIDPQITQDPAVGIYLDGVYIARSTGTALDVADLERIEVLRGPQGTLYGRNTTGGAVNLVTRRPDPSAFTVDQQVSFGNFGLLKSKSVVNTPLSDALAVKLAVMASRKDGFVGNTGPGGDFGDRQQLGARFDLRYDGWDDVLLDFSTDYSDSTQWNYMFQSVLTPESNKGPSEQIKREAQAHTVYSDRRLDSLATGVPLEAGGARILGHALTLSGDWEALQWKYIGAYRELTDETYTDLGGGAGSTDFRVDSGAYDGPAALLANGGPLPMEVDTLTQHQWSHELQLGSGFMDGRLNVIGGVFWFSEQGAEDWPLHHQFSAALNPDQTSDVAGPVFSALGPRLVSIVDLRNTIDNEAFAAFGQLSWIPDIWDQRLRMTFGFRHSEDRRAATKTKISTNYLEMQQDGVGVAVPITNPVNLPSNPLIDAVIGNVALLNVEQFDAVPARRKDRDNSMSLVAEWTASDDVNLYGKYVEAYKGGGFNTRDPQVDGSTRPAPDGNVYGFGFTQGFAPEYVRAFELGAKSEFWNRRLRVNGDVFQTQYEDMQINFLIPGTISDTKVANAGEARMSGVEVDATLAATRSVILTASYAYLDARITRVTDRITGENVADEFQFSSAPRHSVSASADWVIWTDAWGSVSAHGAYSYVGARAGGTKSGAPVGLPAYQLFNLRVMARDLRIAGVSGFGVAVWAKNLLGEDYEISAIDNLPQADRAVIWGEPRSFGLDLSYRY